MKIKKPEKEDIKYFLEQKNGLIPRFGIYIVLFIFIFSVSWLFLIQYSDNMTFPVKLENKIGVSYIPSSIVQGNFNVGMNVNIDIIDDFLGKKSVNGIIDSIGKPDYNLIVPIHIKFDNIYYNLLISNSFNCKAELRILDKKTNLLEKILRNKLDNYISK